MNLGVFLCIRCSGIHRGLGVHISQVRSINMDKWLPEQIENMQQKGNGWATEVYEHDLPPGTKPTPATGDAAMERFTRAKYEEKRWYNKAAASAKVRRTIALPSIGRSICRF